MDPRGVIKAINKFQDCRWAGPGTHSSLHCVEFQRAHTAPETMPHFLPGSCRPEPVSWARPHALAKPLSTSQTGPAIPMTKVIASSLPCKSRRTSSLKGAAAHISHSPWWEACGPTPICILCLASPWNRVQRSPNQAFQPFWHPFLSKFG